MNAFIIIFLLDEYRYDLQLFLIIVNSKYITFILNKYRNEELIYII